MSKKLPKGLSTPSLKDALEGKSGDKKELSAIETHKMHTEFQENEKFTNEDLTTKWNEYLSTLDDHPNLKSTLSRLPEIKENSRLLLKIDNSIQNDLINTVKPELVAFLRKELKNTSIELEVKISESVKNKIIYTDDDKFGEMVKKNPALAKLKAKFNLDFGEV